MRFWNELKEADAHPLDAVGWVGNQCAHFSIGLVLTFTVVQLWLPATVGLVLVTLSYALVWEWSIQGWKRERFDSLVDTAFVLMGAYLATLLPPKAALVLVILAIAIAIGTYNRR